MSMWACVVRSEHVEKPRITSSVTMIMSVCLKRWCVHRDADVIDGLSVVGAMHNATALLVRHVLCG